MVIKVTFRGTGVPLQSTVNVSSLLKKQADSVKRVTAHEKDHAVKPVSDSLTRKLKNKKASENIPEPSGKVAADDNDEDDDEDDNLDDAAQGQSQSKKKKRKRGGGGGAGKAKKS